MSNDQERAEELRRTKKAEALYRVCNEGLEGAIERMGGELTGFSVKTSGFDVLLTLRIKMPAGRFIAHVGASTVGNVLMKAARLASTDGLRLKPDEWATRGG